MNEKTLTQIVTNIDGGEDIVTWKATTCAVDEDTTPSAWQFHKIPELKPAPRVPNPQETINSELRFEISMLKTRIQSLENRIREITGLI